MRDLNKKLNGMDLFNDHTFDLITQCRSNDLEASTIHVITAASLLASTRR